MRSLVVVKFAIEKISTDKHGYSEVQLSETAYCVLADVKNFTSLYVC